MDFFASSSSTTRRANPEEELLPQTSAAETPHRPENVEQRTPSSFSLPPPNPPENLPAELKHEKIIFLDHCYNNSQDSDENYQPENINYASLISRIRGIRGGGQIQYRIARKRGSGGSKKRKSTDDMEVDDMDVDSMEVDDSPELGSEIVMGDRQKRVKRLRTHPRGSPYDKRLRKSAKKGLPDDKQTSLTDPTETLNPPETVT